MATTETIQAIKAEIERHLNSATEHQNANPDMPKYRWYLYEGEKELCTDLLGYIDDSLESEKPINPEAAMKKLDEKIALVKQRGTWDGVDVDKYMDEVRGRESEKPMGLEEEVKRYYSDNFAYISSDQPTLSILTNIARHFTDWQKEQMMKEAVEGKIIFLLNGDVAINIGDMDEYKLGDKVRIIIVKED